MDKKTYKLTRAQQLIYSTEIANGESISTISASALSVREYNFEAYQFALNKIVECNEAMRLRVIEEFNYPVQYVDDFKSYTFEVLKFDSDEEFSAWAENQAKKAIKFSDILYTMYGIEVNGRVGIFANVHHLIADACSMALIGTQFFEYYDKFLKQDYDVQDNPAFTASIETENQYIETSRYSADKDYWRRVISENLDSASISVKNGIGNKASRMVYEIDSQSKAKIDDFCSQNNVSVFSFLLSSFSYVLSRYINKKNLCVRTSLLNRCGKIEKKTIGMFVNVIPLDVGFGECSFIEYVRKNSSCVFSALKHQRCVGINIYDDTDEINELLSAEYDVSFSFHNTIPYIAGEVVDFEWYHSGEQLNSLDVHIRMSPNNTYLAYIDYKTSKFDCWEIEALYQHLLAAINMFVADPNQSLCFPANFISKDERSLIDTFSLGSVVPIEFENIIEKFRNVVSRYPNSSAVVCDNLRITYFELDHLTDTLASYISRNCRDEEYILVWANKKIETIVGIIAILKSEKTYIPVDPNWPTERITHIINDSSASTILRTSSEDADVVECRGISVSDVCNEPNSSDLEFSSNSTSAYVIYTSGTTGVPKGVLVGHKGITNLVQHFERAYSIGNNDRILQFHNIAYDGSVWEMFTALLTGATLVIPNENERIDVFLLEKLIIENDVTIMALPPQFCARMPKDKIRSRIIITAGSESTKEIIEKFGKDRLYLNCYGPTEASVCVSVWECQGDIVIKDRIPLGGPITNTEIYIMNGDEACGIGMPGELCISGVCLAEGYLNREELTSEKFQSSCSLNKIMYRTGDLARWLPDGSIDFLGRIDEQVKVRGFRIELGEIENAIRECCEADEIVVTAKADESGDVALYAYIVSKQEVDFGNIKNALEEKLPDYMIPQYYSMLDEIPITRNGKIDYAKLPSVAKISNREYVAPTSLAQKTICDAYQKVLHAEKVGLKDDFFELGGDSIKAIRVVSCAREAGCSVSVRDVLEYRVVELVAAKATVANLDKYEQGQVIGEVENTPIIQRYLSWNLSKPSQFNQSIILDIPDVSEEILQQSLIKLAEHHDMLRARVVCDKLFILDINQFTLPKINYYACDDISRDIIVNNCIKLQETLDVTDGPLMAFAVFRTEAESKLFICIHHLLVDGVSWRILVEDLISLLVSACNTTLPRKTASFKQWSLEIEKYRNSKIVESRLSYWHDYAKHASQGLLSLTKTGCHGKLVLDFIIEQDVVKDIVEKGIAQFKTDIRTILASSFCYAMYYRYQQQFLTINFESHGRMCDDLNVDVTRTVGWFTTVYPVMFSCYGNISDSIISCKEEINSVPNGGFDYGFVQQQSPCNADVCFNYLGELDVQDTNGITANVFTENTSSPDNMIAEKIIIDCYVSDGTIRCLLTFNKEYFTDDEAAVLAKEYEKSLRLYSEYFSNSEHVYTTISDTDADDLSDDDLSVINQLII